MSGSYRIVFAVLLAVCCNTRSVADYPPDRTGDSIGPASAGPVCEWQPTHQQSLPAGGQCGFNDVGAPNPGIYECGMVRDGNACVEKCAVFTRCQNP
jgi:hypothetical protein